MRFYRVQDIVLLVAAAVGLAVMLLAGATSPIATILVPPAFVAALIVPRRWMDSRRWERAWTVAAVVVFAAEGAALAAGGSALTSAAELSVYLQIHKLFHRVSARDHEQIAILSLAHIAFATILLTGLKYAALLVAFVIAAPLLLTLGYLRKEIEQKYSSAADGVRDEQTLERVLRTRRIATPGFVATMLAMSAPLLVLTALFFVALPRLGFGLLARSARGSFVTGFSDRIVLGDLEPMADDSSPVMRVEFPDGAPDAYALATMRFRGIAFDRYDGRSWERTTFADPASFRKTPEGTYVLHAPGPPPASTYHVRILQEPLDPKLLFLPAGTVSLEFRPALPRQPGPQLDPLEWRADGAVLYRDSGDEGVLYEVEVGRWDGDTRLPDSGAWYAEDLSYDPYLALPPSSERLVDLGERLTAGTADPRARAQAVADYLRSLEYTRTTAARTSGKPLEDFLFVWKRGHCEYFSSAMALLARTAGLRSRNVNGFIGGHWNDVGGYLTVRQQDAHSWAEVAIPGTGWVVFDATPASDAPALDRTGGIFGWLRDLIDSLQTAWQRHVLAFDLGRQVGILSAIAGSLRAAKNAVVRFCRANAVELGVVVGLIAAVVAGLLVRRGLGRRRPGRLRLGPGAGGTAPAAPHLLEARKLLADVEKVLRGVGVERAAHEPAERLRDRARSRGPRLGDATAVAVECYLAARFGFGALSTPDRRDLVRSVAAAARGSR